MTSKPHARPGTAISSEKSKGGPPDAAVAQPADPPPDSPPEPVRRADLVVFFLAIGAYALMFATLIYEAIAALFR
jgi:hypothetical protein